MSYTYSLKWETVENRNKFRITVSRITLDTMTCPLCGHIAADNDMLTYTREYEPWSPILFGCGVLRCSDQLCVLVAEAGSLLSALMRAESTTPLSFRQMLPIARTLSGAEWGCNPGSDDWEVFVAFLVTREGDGSLTIGLSGKLP